MASGLPVFGTCAGLILVAGTVVDGRPGQRTFGCIDLVVRRNGYGRQAQSFECDLAVSGLDDVDPEETGTGAHRPDGRILAGGEAADRAMHAVFIRAPAVERAGPGVEVLATLPIGGFPAPVVCRQGPVLVAAFHPELAGDARLHQMLLQKI